MTEARYDAVAEFYAAAFDAIDDPASRALLSLLGPPAGRRVADVACGHGRITRELARRGAEVTGVDISAALIDKAIAAERGGPLSIRYVHADIAAAVPPGLGTSTFDAVTCNFGLSDIDDLDGTITTIEALLRPGGCFVFSILHPCFAGAAEVSAAWPEGGRYYDEGRWHADARLSPLRRQVGANHRMLSTYLNALRRHKLRLDELSEPVPDPQWSRNRPGADRGPVYLAARYLKVQPRRRAAAADG
jgi:ubiquinone/menaquinone biosynthesis C-methylase UbiE